MGRLAGGGVLALLYIVGAFWFFRRIYRHAVRTGLIARYSAESAA
jgi:ABC-2 type transport system permease protein